MKQKQSIRVGLWAALLISGAFWIAPDTSIAQVPGGTLDPLTIPKYVTPLVIPPVMNNDGAANSYDIAVRQFKQQILPGGIWNGINGRTDAFPATTVWSYGPLLDTPPAIAPAADSQFNYPAYTIETMSGTPVNVQWINDLVDANGNYRPHLLPVDQTLHWANPSQQTCMDGTNRTDCATGNPAPYTGPVPIVTHVHGAHVLPHSDGYPEAWWLPAANNIPAGYARKGTLFDDSTGANPGTGGYADYSYINDNSATTLWYHDHTLGMTRLNVYAGPAGFWLVRGGSYDGATVSGGGPATLPGPAPVAEQTVLQLNVPTDSVRQSIREIPIVIQDRSFNADGSLFYPASRTFFDGYPGPYTGSTPISTDIAPTWNPEAFFNTMVVNGVTWPVLEVAPALYRFRLLNGCNSRFLNLALFEVIKDPAQGKKQKNNAKLGVEFPFYQIGAEQGFLPNVVMISTGFATPLPGDGTIPALVAAPNAQQALLMGLAERADVIVDFRNLPNGTRIRMINTAPDAPFGGFPDVPADPATTGQVMEFVVRNAALTSDANTTPPQNLILNAKDPLGPTTAPDRLVSLNEEMSGQVCVQVTPSGRIKVVQVLQPPPLTEAQITAACAALNAVPMAPKAALLGIVDNTNPAMPLGIPLKWTDTTVTSTTVPVTMADGVTVNMIPVTENPTEGAIEQWDIYNFTVDAHPIHLHLVEFQVTGRTPIPGVVPAPVPVGVQPWETGFKDTVIAYPGEITSVKALFDIPGLYVWHCHIVEHEDNEMMRPFVVSP